MSKFTAFMSDGSSFVVELHAGGPTADGDAMAWSEEADMIGTDDGSWINVWAIVSLQPFVEGAERPADQFVKGWFRR